VKDMAHFPMFVSLKDKSILIIGGGKVAYRKIKKLIPFGPKIHLIAKQIKEEKILNLAKNYNIDIEERAFLFTDLDSKDMVIVAIDDIKLQEEIFNFCYRRKIPVNCVDNPKFCTFLFPSYIKENDIVIGISSSGYAPALSKKLKEKIKNCLPKNLNEVLEKLKELRKKEKKGVERQKKIYKILNDYF
jgi:precorrin-2 dehydrogenase/sirohydrochlorin ferrochelatase